MSVDWNADSAVGLAATEQVLGARGVLLPVLTQGTPDIVLQRRASSRPVLGSTTCCATKSLWRSSDGISARRCCTNTLSCDISGTPRRFAATATQTMTTIDHAAATDLLALGPARDRPRIQTTCEGVRHGGRGARCKNHTRKPSRTATPRPYELAVSPTRMATEEAQLVAILGRFLVASQGGTFQISLGKPKRSLNAHDMIAASDMVIAGTCLQTLAVQGARRKGN